MKVTIEDVALKAGVSIATVSRVINNNYPVKEKTREKVESVIKEMNFKPNLMARGLIIKKTHTVGVLVPGISNMFFTALVEAVQQFFTINGYHILLCITLGDPKSEVEQIEKLIERSVDGIICIDPRTANIKSGYYNKISKQLPFVIVNGFSEGIKLNFIMNDQVAGTLDALRHLEALGHNKIGFLRAKNSHSYDIKQEVYEAFIKENSGKPYIMEIEKGNSIETVHMAKELFIKTFRKKVISHDITAIFCCNDWMATGVINACHQLKILIPDNLSVIGFDNIPISEMTTPKLTTVNQNTEMLGTISAERLFALMKKNEPKAPYTKTLLDTELIIRETTGKAAF